MASPGFIVRLFEVALDVCCRFIFILINIFLSERDVWDNKNLENGGKILLNESCQVRKGCALSKVPYYCKDQSFALFVGGESLGRDQAPYLLEESFAILLEVLGKFKLVEVHESDNLRLGLEKIFLVGAGLQTGEVSLQDEDAALADLCKVVDIEIRQLFLTENGLDDVEDGVDDTDQ